MRLEDYIQELNRIKLLEPEQEAELWKAFKEDKNEDARRRLIQSYQPLVFKNALPFRSMDGIMDIIQEGTVGLIEAAEKFDYHRGVAFSLFAVHRIRGRMLNFIRKEGASELTCIDDLGNDGISIKDRIADTALSVSEQAEMHEITVHLKEALTRLPEKERLVLERVYLESAEIKDVAVLLDLSIAHIYRLQKTGIRRIRGMLSQFMQRW